MGILEEKNFEISDFHILRRTGSNFRVHYFLRKKFTRFSSSYQMFDFRNFRYLLIQFQTNRIPICYFVIWSP